MAYYKNSVGPTIRFQNSFNALSKGGAQGVAAGANFGTRGMLIGAAIGGAVGTLGSYLNNREAYKQGKQQLKIAKIANRAMLTLVGRNLNEINRQRTILSMETQSALLYALAKGRAQNASLANVYAAADQVGNQQLYQQSAVQNVVDEQQYQSLFNLLTQQLNLNVQVQNLINASKDKFVGVNVLGGDFSIGLAFNDLMSIAGTVLQKINFGGGNSATKYTGSANFDPSKGGYTLNTDSSNSFTNNWLNSSSGKVVYGGNVSKQYSDMLGISGSNGASNGFMNNWLKG